MTPTSFTRKNNSSGHPVIRSSGHPGFSVFRESATGTESMVESASNIIVFILTSSFFILTSSFFILLHPSSSLSFDHREQGRFRKGLCMADVLRSESTDMSHVTCHMARRSGIMEQDKRVNRDPMLAYPQLKSLRLRLLPKKSTFAPESCRSCFRISPFVREAISQPSKTTA